MRPRLELLARETLAVDVSLDASPARDAHVREVTIDGESLFSRVMRAGERESYEVNDEIVLTVGDAGAFAFAINQQDGRSLGASGEVVTVTITLQNYRGFVVP